MRREHFPADQLLITSTVKGLYLWKFLSSPAGICTVPGTKGPQASLATTLIQRVLIIYNIQAGGILLWK